MTPGTLLVWHDAGKFSNPGQDAVLAALVSMRFLRRGREMRSHARLGCEGAAWLGGCGESHCLALFALAATGKHEGSGGDCGAAARIEKA
jgi:hypothetical protein